MEEDKRTEKVLVSSKRDVFSRYWKGVR